MEISELARLQARFQAVVSALISPAQGALLVGAGDSEASFHVGAHQGRPVAAHVIMLSDLAAEPLSEASIQRLHELVATREERGFHLRLIIISGSPALQSVLRTMQQEAATTPSLQLFQVDLSGKVWSQASLLFTEVRAALKEQAKATLPTDDASAQAALLAFQDQLRAEEKRAHARIDDVNQFQRQLQQRKFHVTYALLGLHGVLFALCYLWGSPESNATLSRMGAQLPDRIRAGEYWRLLSTTTLHGGVVHLLMNSFGLWSLGAFLERLIGGPRFLMLYVLSGLGGSLLGTLLAPADTLSISVGSSGAVCGMLMACALLALKPRGALPELMAKNLRNSALINLALTVLISMRPHVDYLAHAGGALVGIVLWLLGTLRPIPVQKKEARAVPRRLIERLLLVLMTTLLCGSVATAIWHGKPWELTRTPQLQTVKLSGAGLQLDLPQLLGDKPGALRSDNDRLWVFGDFRRAPLVMLVSLARYQTPMLDDAAKKARLQVLRDQLQAAPRGNTQAQRFTPQTELRELSLPDGPTLERAQKLEDGLTRVQLLQVRRDYEVLLELRYAPEASARILPDLPKILGTLRPVP